MNFLNKLPPFFRGQLYLCRHECSALSPTFISGKRDRDCWPGHPSDTIYRVEHEHNAIVKSRQADINCISHIDTETGMGLGLGQLYILLYNFYYLFRGSCDEVRGGANLGPHICKLFKLVLFLCNFLRGTFCVASRRRGCRSRIAFFISFCRHSYTRAPLYC